MKSNYNPQQTNINKNNKNNQKIILPPKKSEDLGIYRQKK